MAIRRTQCVQCGATDKYDDEWDLPDVEDPDIELPELPDPKPILCEACGVKAVKQFPPVERDPRGTLTEVLIADKNLFLDAIEEGIAQYRDPDVQAAREMFPMAEVSKPRRKRMARNQPIMAEILRTVGKPVWYYSPELDGMGGCPYLVYHLNAKGESSYGNYDLVQLVEMGDVANALDYGPTGKPLK